MTPHLIFNRIDEPDLNTLAVYERRGGYESLRQVLQFPADAVVEEISASGIRGRGGAGFKMGQKASFLPKNDAVRYLVCNADESEPGTFKDREILQKTPHMLIEGIVIACFGTNIHEAFIYIRGEYELQAQRLQAAVQEAYDAGYLGENILGSGFSLELTVHRGAGAYICGEETGLLDSLEGRRGNPRLKPPFPAVQGLYQGPTLINNVETLSTVPQIIRMGGAEYAKLGTETSTGTKLISVSGDVQRPGNYEIELGTSSRDIIYGLAGGPKPGHEIKMWFPGGSSSPVLLPEDIGVAYDFDTLQKAGTMLGSGAIIVIDDTHSVLAVMQKVAKFYSHESCGKCVPCREGTNWTKKMLARFATGDATPMDIDILDSIQGQIMGHCLCVLGDAMAMPLGSIIKKFRSELEGEILDAREHAANAPADDAIPVLAGLAGAYPGAL
jgi:NADH-quinone oxidoreductase subunit F